MANLNIKHLFFGSVADLRADCTKPFKVIYNAEKSVYFRTNPRPGFHGVSHPSEVLRMIVEGYPEGEQNVRTFHDAIAASLPRAVGYNRTKRKAAFGDELDIHAMNRGQFDRAWSVSNRAIKKGTGILRLVVDIGGNAMANVDSLRWRGIAGLALAEIMGKAGYSVEIIAAFAVQNYTQSCSTDAVTVSTVVKQRSSQADIGLLASTVTLPGFFRTLGFHAICRGADELRKIVNSSLGNYLDVSGVLPVPDKMTQLIVPSHVMSKETAEKWVRDSVTLLQGATA